MTDGIALRRKDDLPPLDSRALDFDVCREMRRTVVDLIRGGEKTTILGALLEHVSEGLTGEALAQRLGLEVGLVAWQVDRLEEEDLCVRSEIDGEIKVLPFAAYTERNE